MALIAYGFASAVVNRGLVVCCRVQRRWMSVRPQEIKSLQTPRKKVTIQTLQTQKTSHKPITMLTAYDYPTALACSSNPSLDITLIGDSLAQVCLGYPDTTQLTLPEMIHHARAVARGTTHPLLIADLPFGTYQISPEDSVRNAIQLIQQGHVEGVKLEGGTEIKHIIKKLTTAGIPVMGHVGLLPQRYVSMSGYKIQGKSASSARKVVQDALAVQDAGAFAVVVEGVPRELGKFITHQLDIPTIGIGAGPDTDGQVLVWDDMMGTWHGHKAKFVRRFGDLRTPRDEAVERYVKAVRERSFPDDSESYGVDVEEWKLFLDSWDGDGKV